MHPSAPAPSASSLSRAERQGLLSLAVLAIVAFVAMSRLPGTHVAAPIAGPGRQPAGVAPDVDAGPDELRTTPAVASPLDGRFRLRASRSSVQGDSRCASIATRVQWDQVSIEQFRVSSDGRRFDVPTRPGLTGAIDPSGAFESRVMHGERDGTTSSFHMYGWANATGFRAIGETRTRTLLRWRHVLDCVFIAEFVGVRLSTTSTPAPSPHP